MCACEHYVFHGVADLLLGVGGFLARDFTGTLHRIFVHYFVQNFLTFPEFNSRLILSETDLLRNGYGNKPQQEYVTTEHGCDHRNHIQTVTVTNLTSMCRDSNNGTIKNT